MIDYSIHIDYLTISFPDCPAGYEPLKAFYETLPEYAKHLEETSAPLIQIGGRAPYNVSFSWGGVGVFCSTKVQGFMLEIGGQACQYMGLEYIKHLIESYRITRIDIALDMRIGHSVLIDILPTLRLKPTSTFDTQEGETAYFGSMKSDTYCRIYRYNPPHPRYELLRIEVVYKNHKTIEQIKGDILSDGGRGLVQKRLDKLGFSLVTLGESSKTRLSSTETKNTPKLSWIIRQIAPAIRRMIADGTIENPDEFFKRYFIPERGVKPNE